MVRLAQLADCERRLEQRAARRPISRHWPTKRPSLEIVPAAAGSVSLLRSIGNKPASCGFHSPVERSLNSLGVFVVVSIRDALTQSRCLPMERDDISNNYSIEVVVRLGQWSSHSTN